MDGLVGKKYPGSTGGEFFNYYGTDSYANKAIGNYSTAVGRKNITYGKYSFTGGYDNTSYGDYSLMFGTGNSSQDHAARNIVLGHYNTLTGGVQENYMLGNGLSSNRNYLTIIGSHNATPAITNPRIILGAGPNSNTKRNAVEISTSSAKILYNLQLAADDTEVNAITAPQDPDNVTQDDMTLVTKSYTKNLSDVAKVHGMWADSLPNSVVLPADGSTIAFAYGGIYDEPPSWATRVQVTFIWEGEYFTPIISLDRTGGIHLDVKQTDTSMQPDLVIRHAHVRLDYQSAAKTLQILDYWEYSHNITTNTISNIITGISNAAPVYVYNINYMN